jgi:hypothetical protein
MPGKSHRGPLPPLTPEQSALVPALRRDVVELAEKIGERNVGKVRRAPPGRGLCRIADGAAGPRDASHLSCERPAVRQPRGGDPRNVGARRDRRRGRPLRLGRPLPGRERQRERRRGDARPGPHAGRRFPGPHAPVRRVRQRGAAPFPDGGDGQPRLRAPLPRSEGKRRGHGESRDHRLLQRRARAARSIRSRSASSTRRKATSSRSSATSRLARWCADASGRSARRPPSRPKAAPSRPSCRASAGPITNPSGRTAIPA